ncbi:MAG: metal-dependent transcriptional regulator [Bacteroidota bacterium]
MHLSYTEENYLKAIYQQTKGESKAVSTNALAEALKTSPAAVTDMVKRLHEKNLVNYQKYQGTYISETGQLYALQVIRKHLLWEVFLVDKLKLDWDKVHEIAEQLEHIQSPMLVQRLDDFLGNPTYSPHGKPIPNAQGEIIAKKQIPLTDLAVNTSASIIAVKEGTPQFLQHLSKRGIYLGAKVTVIESLAFDQSMDISIDHLPKINISKKVSDNILVTL